MRLLHVTPRTMGRKPHARRRPGVITAVCLAMVALIGFDLPAHAQDRVERQQEIKAAFLYNFAKFTEWPQAQTTVTNICLLGEDPVWDALQSIVGKTARGRPIEVRRGTAFREIRGCHIVFVSSSTEMRTLPGVLESLTREGALTVGDTDEFAGLGGMIGLKVRRNRMLMEINLTAIEEAGLKVSSQLLTLASIIRSESPAVDSEGAGSAAFERRERVTFVTFR